ncbi:MAG: hypothetical protein RIQ89_564 [Bacteroidota bacterium]|jgi:uncharacterized protein YqgC (DUF456 family)
MATFLAILAVILCVTGIFGCFIPALPGPPLNLIALFIIQYLFNPFSSFFIISISVITVLALVFDYLLPIITARKFGATPSGIKGSVIGMVLGIFLTPVGMILGLIIGSILGDLYAQQSLSKATKAAAGSLIGTLITIGLKLMLAGFITFLVGFHLVKQLF